MKLVLAATLLALASAELVSHDYCLPLPIRWGDYYPLWKIFKPQSTITYKCTGGYKLIGHATATCLGSYWDHPYPTCVRTPKCKHPYQPGYGYITPYKSYYEVGDIITYKCNNGYDLDGYDVHTCQKNGYWNYPPPKCLTYKCHDPPHYDYGSYSPIQAVYKAGDVIEYSCYDGYTLHGYPSSSCLKGGSWSHPPPSCSKFCGPPRKIEHGYYAPRRSEYKPGDYVTYDCYDNRRIQGYKVIRCDEYGQWPTQYPSCGNPACPRPDRPKGGYFYPSKPYYAPGEMVHFSCGTHSIQGPKYVTCLDNGYWSGYVPKCVAPHCPKPKRPKYGFFGPVKDYYKQDEAIWFKCKHPYILKGQKDIHCLKGGKWSFPEPQCVLPQCPQPAKIEYGGYHVAHHFYPHGYIPYKLYPIGIKIEYYCQYPYAAKGPSIITCKRGGHWSHHPPTCEHGCKPPVIPQIGYITPEKPVYAPGEQIWIKCPKGFRVEPESDIVCIGHHNWSQNEVRCVTEGSCKGQCHDTHPGNSCSCEVETCKKHRYNCCTDFYDVCFDSIPYFD